MNAQAQPLHEVDLDNPDAVVDGTVDDSGEDVSRETSASNDDKKPTREEQLQSADLTDLQKECYKAIKEIETLESKRSEINAQMKAIRERMEAKGISKKALAIVLQVAKMNEDQLDGLDTSYLMLRKAISLPVQSELFGVLSDHE